MSTFDPEKLILAAPIIFVIHVIEEAPGFVGWFNSLADPDITQRMFLNVNAAAFVITIATTAAFALARDKLTAYSVIAWLSFLFFANAILHITGTLVHNRYSPGVITATFLYLPYFSGLVFAIIRRYDLPVIATAATIILGSTPMLAHAYMIIFKGGRLF